MQVTSRLNLSDAIAGLDRLSASMGEQTLRSGVFAAADLVRNQAIRNAPEKSGVLKRNIIVKRKEEDSDGANRQTYLVVIRKGKMNVEGDAFYGYWVENGHKIVRRKPKGVAWKAHRSAEAIEFGDSRTPAHPFLRPAWESLKGMLLDVMRERMRAKMKEQLGAKP